MSDAMDVDYPYNEEEFEFEDDRTNEERLIDAMGRFAARFVYDLFGMMLPGASFPDESDEEPADDPQPEFTPETCPGHTWLDGRCVRCETVQFLGN